jgi:hypothetical protein
MSQTENYRDLAESDAKSTVSNFRDEIVEMLLDDGKASDDLLNDYPGGDSYHHETHTDKWYNLQEAAAVLDQLDNFEETDSGLWQGQDMKTALATCAAYTYANAVYSEWHDLIGTINDRAEDILSDFITEETDLETERDEPRTMTEAARTCAAEKQALLDSLDIRKADALREMVDEIAS